MKISTVIIFVFMIGTLGLSAQKSETPSPAQITPPATQDSIVFEETMHDYGDIELGGDGNYTFVFKNKGKLPLFLSQVRSSCGCTIPEWPREAIGPGKTGTIKVIYDTKRAGTFSKTITVKSNAANSTVILQIKGNITPRLIDNQ